MHSDLENKAAVILPGGQPRLYYMIHLKFPDEIKRYADPGEEEEDDEVGDGVAAE